MRESVPKSKLESLSSTRPSPLVQERYELKEVGWREDSDADNKLAEKKCLLVDEESEFLCNTLPYCTNTDTYTIFTAPVGSDNIPVTEFPDYVLKVTKENEYNHSKLADEYQVNTIYHHVPPSPVSLTTVVISVSSNFIVSPPQVMILPVSLTILTSTDSGIYTHVRIQKDIIMKYLHFIKDDDSRVSLEEIPGELGSDYINASCVSVSPIFSLRMLLALIAHLQGICWK